MSKPEYTNNGVWIDWPDVPSMAKYDENAALIDWRKVLEETRICARSWEPGVRILGNVRAGDLARAIDSALAALSEPPGAI